MSNLLKKADVEDVYRLDDSDRAELRGFKRWVRRLEDKDKVLPVSIAGELPRESDLHQILEG